MSGKRRPRFKRARTRPFQVTERDVEIVQAVYRHRLLNSEHIVSLIEGSDQGIRRRLQLLFHARFLDRPPVQVANFHIAPSPEPMVYALGNKGADLLAEHLGVPRASIDWTTKNRKLKEIFFRHTLMVAGIMVAFEVACREAGNMRLIPWEEILAERASEETRREKRPESWRVKVPGRGEHGITPDAIFGLHYLDRSEGRNRSFFFLEADRGTMPVKRRHLAQTAIYKKLLLYHQTAVQKLHTKRFGMKAFRVLTVTASPERERVASMVKAAGELDGFQGLFLFADETSVLERGPLAVEWVDGRGGSTVLRN